MGRHLGSECSICQVLNNSTTSVEKVRSPIKDGTGKFLGSRAKIGKNIVQRPEHKKQAVNGYAFPPRIS